jgi:hypothetical protein
MVLLIKFIKNQLIEIPGMKAFRNDSEMIKNLGKIVLVFLFLLFASLKGFGQTAVTQTDSLKVRQKNGETAGQTNAQNRNGYGNGQAGANAGPQAVKRVRAGRPDMSRARGARPPMIVRPSGSGIPKGIGKPGGVGRHGGR